MSLFKGEHDPITANDHAPLTTLVTANSDTLARRMWPALMMTRLPADPKMSELVAWQIVPSEYDDICSWLAIDRSEEGAKATHPFVLLYAPDISPIKDERVKVSMRVYGIVESLSISPTGNYMG